MSQHSTIKRLKLYSTFSSVFLLTYSSVKSQVVYHDLNPDIVLDSAGEFALLDINSDSIIDFEFLNSSFTFYSASFSSYLLRKDILVGPHISQNGLAGISNHYSFGYFDFYRFFPYALSVSANVNESLLWQTNGVQIMALVTMNADDSELFSYCFECEFYGFYQIGDLLDHYLGIRFIDGEGVNHYGWIRCDVTNLGRRLVIKDFAYETVPDYPIEAGSLTSFATIKSNKPMMANVYAGEGAIHVDVTQRPEERYSVQIFNISGQMVFDDEYSNTFVAIPFLQPLGMYIVNVICGVQRVTKEVVITN